MDKYQLKLFITGQSPRSLLTIANLRRICDDAMRSEYELTIIDVLEQPQLAEEGKILVTPTLIKQFPLPIRRIIGDLSDKERVLWALGLATSEIKKGDK